MSNAIVRVEQVPYADLQGMARNVVQSRFFGVKTQEEALTLMLLAQAEGLHPIQAMRQFHVINGRPSMRADAMLAKFQEAGGRIQWVSRTEAEVEAVFSHPSSGDTPVKWTMGMAHSAGLTGNPTWKKFPRQMLSARVISEGVRMALPSVVVGIYTPEEVEDFEPVGAAPAARVEPVLQPITEVLPPVEETQVAREDWRTSPEAEEQLRELYEAAAGRFVGADEKGLWTWFNSLTASPKFGQAWEKDSAEACSKFLTAVNAGKYDAAVEKATGFKLEGVVA